MGAVSRVREWVRARVAGALGDPTVGGYFSQRFRATVPARAPTADAHGCEAVTYYVYGGTRDEALARLLDLPADAVVESAGYVVGGVLHLPLDELRVDIVDGRAAPGTPGPVR